MTEFQEQVRSVTLDVTVVRGIGRARRSYHCGMARAGSGDRLTKIMILAVVLPTCLIVFSFLAQLPLALVAGLLSINGDAVQWAIMIVGYLLGGSGALWVCRFAWPKRSKVPRDPASAS